ncbi:MAG: amidase domain-containing protein [Lachnospiraceae bacterium]|nr:amidase domain-containing protein [Lachnospiraceae bacterium]
MKKHTAIALVSAIAIAAGTLSAVNLTNTSRDAQESAVSSGESAGISYEDAIADLYARSTSISDQEILDIARKMKPDCSAVTDELGEAQANRIIETLSAYEEEKASYLLAGTAAEADDAITAEWERQRDYTQMGISGSQKLTRLIPGYTVTSCEEENGRVLVDVDEWMTEGYTEGEQDTENVSAYRYYYTAVLEESTGGNWEVVSVINTDRNFAWLEDAEVQQQMLGESAAQAGADLQNSIETGAEAGAESAADLQGNSGMKTASLKTYGDGKYSYNADNAIAYADKWATSRNPEYRQYPGVDCCNFVSQCLYAGGMPKNSAWYPASYAWINCSGAIDNFKKYGTFMSANNGNVLRGNPVYYDWNSNGVYDHTAICVGKNSSGTPIIDAHTGDHYHVTWTLGSNGTRATIQLRGNGSVSGSSTANASGGSWKKENGSWYYYTADGTMLKASWIKYQNNYYYLRAKGPMVTGWARIGGSWYYFNGAGVMKTGWIKSGGKWYYLSDQGAMKTGWVKVSGSWYYMADDGHAVTGWRDIKGKTYYFGGDCKMKTGLCTIDGMKYYFGSQGQMTLGWITTGGKKYFFSPSAGGRAATGSWQINGRTYNFNSEGVLVD